MQRGILLPLPRFQTKKLIGELAPDAECSVASVRMYRLTFRMYEIIRSLFLKRTRYPSDQEAV